MRVLDCRRSRPRRSRPLTKLELALLAGLMQLGAAFDDQGTGFVAFELHNELLDVEHHLGDVLEHSFHGRELMEHAVDLDPGDAAAFEPGQQNSPQTVADGHAEAAFERFNHELAIIDRLAAGLFDDHLAWQFQALPPDAH